MPSHNQLSRRQFTALAALGAAGTLVPDAVPAAFSAPGSRAARWPGYDRAIVIDNLATPGPFNVPNGFEHPYTDVMVANARASGITAVNVTISGGGTLGATAFESSVRNVGFLERELDRHPDAFVKVKSVADIRRAKQERKLGLIPGFQDATMLESDVSRVDLFHQLGVRIIQLTYNVRNLVGDGCLEPANAGLSSFGRGVVARMNQAGMLVDVSHCGRQTTLDAIAHSTKPIAATHSSCAALNDVPRSKTDDQLRRMAAKGGVVGIYMMPFLRASGQPTADDFIRHVEHAINVAGEDHVGVGSDNSITPLDLSPEFRALHAGFVKQRRAQGISAPGEDENIFNHVSDLDSPRRMDHIADQFATRGHSSARIEKVIGGNWLRLFGEVWQ
jgi:membrane dipeptidase